MTTVSSGMSMSVTTSRDDPAGPGHTFGLTSAMDVRRSLAADRDDVHVEVARVTQHLLDDAVRRTPEGPRSTRAEDDLGSAFTAGERHERRRGVVVDDLLKLAFELLDEFARFGRVGGDVTDLVGLDDVHREEFGSGPSTRSAPHGAGGRRRWRCR